MKTMKKLTIIAGLILLSITVFSQDTKRNRHHDNFAYVTNTNYRLENNFELRDAQHNLHKIFKELLEEVKYVADDYIETESNDLNMIFDSIVEKIKYNADEFINNEEQLNN